MSEKDTKRLSELPSESMFTLYVKRGNMMATIEGKTIALDQTDLQRVQLSIGSHFDFIATDVTKYNGYTILYDVNDIEYSIIAYDYTSKRTYEWSNVKVLRYSFGDRNVDLFITTSIGHKIDRRNAYRVPINKSCIISLGDHKGTVQGEVIDLSSTGVLIRVLDKDLKLNIGDCVSIQFSDRLSRKYDTVQVTLKLSAKIVRVVNTPNNPLKRYGCALIVYDNHKLPQYLAQKQMANINRSGRSWK